MPLKLEHWRPVNAGTVLRAWAGRQLQQALSKCLGPSHGTERWPALGLSGQGKEGWAPQKPERIAVAPGEDKPQQKASRQRGGQWNVYSTHCPPASPSIFSSASHWENPTGGRKKDRVAMLHTVVILTGTGQWWEERRSGGQNGKYPAPHAKGVKKCLFGLVGLGLVM